MKRDGVNRRQVNQLLKAIKDGGTVRTIAAAFNIEHEVVFNFAKKAKIKLKETPESVALQAHSDLIEAEVTRRLAEERKPKKESGFGDVASNEKPNKSA